MSDSAPHQFGLASKRWTGLNRHGDIAADGTQRSDVGRGQGVVVCAGTGLAHKGQPTQDQVW